MCFFVAVLLSDGETVVGMDLNFSKAQESIRRMTEDSDRTAMIVTSGGMIAGYTDMSLVGARADEKLPEYTEILKRVANSKEHDSFRAEIDGSSHMIFSSETSNSWYLILSVDTSVLYGENYRQIAILASVNLLMLAAVVVYCALSSRKARQAENAITETKNSIDGFSGKIRESAAHLQRLGDIRLFREGEDPAELIGQIRDSGQHLAQIADELSLYSDELYEKSKEKSAENKNVSSGTPSRKVRNGIIAALLVSLVIVLAFCMNISVSRGNTRMNREADTYEGYLSKWLTEQKSVLYVLTDVISSHPELLNDYDGAVRFLKDISDGYSDISLCYMANPYAEHPVIMSNGWEPGEDFRPETRPWYRATELSSDGFNISAPYLDAQSGTYCITLSRVVNGGNGEFLGIFGIDFFLDKLVNVLGESYTSKSYAFLVDSDGIIINHPNNAYQMGGDTSTSIADTEYANAFSKDKIDVLRDYSSQFMACLSRRTDSGFTVVVANRWWSVYGSAVLVAAVLMLIFSACLVFVVTLINRLLRWQEEVNRQLVEAADEAQSANRAKSQFLSQMSHEIRTPMNAIIGLDTIALNDDGVSELTRDRLQKIGSSARHMLSLINDILDMSRIESGRMALKEEKFSFRDFIDQIGVIIGGQCEDKGLQFVCRINGQIDEYFTGDDLKLKQVMINILGNSVKFTDAPGVITFTVEQLSGTDERAALRFIMEDTGIGMDKEFIPKLFEAFSQENAGTTNKYGGSGLGMAITKNIVEMMGGEITVESEKGLGSVFTVSVTLGKVTENNAKITAESAEETQSADASLEGLHILIAEDQELNAEILAELFEMEGMTSEWAENGQRAVEMFSESSPGYYGAILMDMRMPVMDGLTATKKIRRLDRRDAKTIPIIAMTANAFEEDIKQCLDAGMNAHQTKPVNIDALKEALLKYLSKSQNNRG